MKNPVSMRTLCATLALAAFASAASAQSSVTIYGLIDLGVTRQNGGTTTLAGGIGGGGPAASNGLASAPASRWDVRQGWASRLGLRAIEDLGGGWRAGFQLEHRFTPDTGALPPGDPFWAGTANVKLIGPMGEVYLGRDNIPAFWVGIATDPFDYGYVGTLGRLHAFGNYVSGDFASTGNGVNTATRTNNTVGYKTPNFDGLSGQLAVSAGEGARGALGREVGANVQYRKGPVYVGFGFDRIRNNGAGNDPQLLMLAGSYDFGVVQPMVSFVRVTPLVGGYTREVSAGARVRMGVGIVKAVVARFDPAGDNNTTLKFGLGYEHVLSRRTSLYTNLGTAKNDAYSRTNAVDFGIRHHF